MYSLNLQKKLDVVKVPIASTVPAYQMRGLFLFHDGHKMIILVVLRNVL